MFTFDAGTIERIDKIIYFGCITQFLDDMLLRGGSSTEVYFCY